MKTIILIVICIIALLLIVPDAAGSIFIIGIVTTLIYLFVSFLTGGKQNER